MTRHAPERAADDIPSARIAHWERWDTLALVLLGVVFVASRLVWLAADPQTASYWEEAYRWVAAHEILAGSARPLLDYQADHYQGGSLVAILLAVGSFRLGGESVLTLKLGALLLSTLTLTLLFATGRCFFGRETALLSGAAYVAGPPLVAFFGLILIGSHSESTLFSLLQIFLLLGLLTGRWRSPPAWFAFGLACGAGISFTYITALSAAACGIAWLWLERRPRWSELAWASAGGVLGLGPWLAYNATHGFAGLGRIAEVFGLRPSPDTWVVRSLSERIGDLLVRVPEGLLDPSHNALPEAVRPLVVALFLVPVGGALAAAAVRAVRAARRPCAADPWAGRELVFAIYAVLFVTALLASRFSLEPHPVTISYRLFPPLVILGTIPVAFSVQRMLEAGRVARVAACVGSATGLLSMAAATLAFASRPPDAGSNLALGPGYLVYGRLLHRKHPDLREAVASARGVDTAARRSSVLWGIGWEVEHRFETTDDLSRVLTQLRAIPDAERTLVVTGLLWGADQRAAELSAGPHPTPEDREMLDRLAALKRAVWAQQAERPAEAGAGS